jgi:hypothetical protein
MRPVAGVLLAATLAAGCTTSAPPGGSPSPARTASPAGTASPAPSVGATTAAPQRLTVRRTGGIAGVNQTLTVEVDGSWVYTDARRPAREAGRLTPAQRDRLQQLLASPALADEILSPRSADPGCADGFRYTLSFGRTSVDRSDCGDLEGPTLTEIVTLLAGATPL